MWKRQRKKSTDFAHKHERRRVWVDLNWADALSARKSSVAAHRRRRHAGRQTIFTVYDRFFSLDVTLEAIEVRTRH